MSRLSFSKFQFPSHSSAPKASFSKSFNVSPISRRSQSKTPNKINHVKESSPLKEKPLQFYFDSKARKKIIIKTINHYMQQSKNPEEDKLIFSHLKPEKRLSKTSQNPRKKRSNDITQRLGVTLGTIQFNKMESIVSEHYAETLPIISQIEERPFRPFSENKQRRSELNESKYPSGRESLINSSIDLQNETTLMNCEQKGTETMLCECQYYSLKKVRQNKSAKKIKKYTLQGKSMLELEKKVHQIGIPVSWQQTILSNTISYPATKSLKQKILSYVSFQNGKEKIYKFFPKQYHVELFQNQNQWLIDIIRGICKQLVKAQGKFMNNKIHVQNIYQIDEKKIRIQDWSCSSSKEIIKVIGRQQPLIKFHKPIFRDKSGWLCNPYCLAPQVLKLYESQFSQFEQIWSENPTGSDMWSLGCMIFQVLTLIPLDMSCRSSVKDRQVFRKGLLALQKFNVEELLRKQSYFSNHYWQYIEKECKHINIDKRVQRILKGVLKYDKKERISGEQVLRILQSRAE